jgi:stage V sporulation protein B
MNQESADRGFAVLGTSSIIVKFLALIYLPIQTFIVKDYGNGIISAGYIIYIFIFSLANAGLPVAISKLISEQAAKGNFKDTIKILKCSFIVLLSLGIIAGAFMLTQAGWLSGVVDQPKAYLMIVALSPALLFTSISCALRGYLQGRQNMAPVAVSQVLEQALNSVLTVVFAAILIKYGVEMAAAGTTVGTTVGAIGADLFLVAVFLKMKTERRREIETSLYEGPSLKSSQIYKEILKYSIPAIINTIATNASNLIDASQCVQRLMVSGYSEAAATALFGVYQNQFMRLFLLAMAFSTALVTAMIPSVASALAVNDKTLLKHRIRISFKQIYHVTLPSIAGITFLAHPMVSLIFFNVESRGSDLVVLGTWTAILMTILYVQSGLLIALGRPIIAPVNIIIGMAVKFVLNYYLLVIPAVNIKGAIISTAVGWVIALALNQMAISRSMPVKVSYMRMLAGPSVASLIMGVVCLAVFKLCTFILALFIPGRLLVNDLGLLFAVAAGILVYFSLMVALGGMTKDEVKMMPLGNRLYALLYKFPFLKNKLA